MRVIPFISKSQTHTEYLVDNCKQSYTPITIVYIAELLAGVPWTATRARQHIVNELSQALHKILIFNNQNNTPIHKWEQSAWYAQWTLTEEGDHVCTLYSNIAVPEQKLKIRKGREFGWRKTPTAIQAILTEPHLDQVQEVEDMAPHWQAMTGLRGATHNPTFTTTARNPFEILTEEENPSS